MADNLLFSLDTGFIVHNRRTYPTLLRLSAELGVVTRSAEMGMSVGCDGCGLEYAAAMGPRAPRRLLWHPHELGLAQAHVSGEIDVPAPHAG